MEEFEFGKWYFNETKTGLYFFETYNRGYGFRANSHIWFRRGLDMGHWNTKDVIPATKREVISWLDSVPNDLTNEERNLNLNISFPDDINVDEWKNNLNDLIEKISFSKNKTGLNDAVQFKVNSNDTWTRIPPILYQILSNLDKMDIRIKPNYNNYKVGEAVIVKFYDSNKRFIRVFAGVNQTGDALVFGETNSKKIPTTECRKMIL